MEQTTLVELDDAFFQEEIRCDYTITADVKKLWYQEMCCMLELQRICRKHNIKFFAGDGTLLGTIRHGGFSPWDDDMDVYMLPEDYDRFCKIAPKEIQSPFFFQHSSTQQGYGTAMARIRNSNTTACTLFEWEIMDRDYNLGIFIDIFPLHYVERNKMKRFFQNTQRYFFCIALNGYYCEKQFVREKNCRRKWGRRKHLSFLMWKLLKPFCGFDVLSRKFYEVCSSCKKSDRVAPITFTGFNSRFIWDLEWFQEVIELPFENISLPVPKKYHEILKTEYGDYMKYVKGTQVHTMVIFDPDIPYSVKMEEFY